MRRFHLRVQGFHVPVGIQDRKGPEHPLLVKNRKPKQIVCVDRLDPVENLDDTVKAFGYAHSKMKDLQMSIYGAMGDSYPKLNKRLTQLFRHFHLTQKSMRIYPYTQHVSQVYREGEITLVTTKDEGFNISLLEALSQGCCGLVYDTNYGPNEMIRNGYDGFVVPRFDWKAMGDKLVEFYSNPQMMQTMSTNAYIQSCRFSPTRIADKWKNLVTIVRRSYYE